MKKLVFLSLLISAVSLQAVLTQLPDAKTLEDNLRQQDFEHFFRATNIVASLAGQERESMGIVMAVELALFDYCDTVPQQAQIAMQIRKADLIQAILKDSSREKEAIEELKAKKIFK